MTRLSALGVAALIGALALAAGGWVSGVLLYLAAEQSHTRLARVHREAVSTVGAVEELGRDRSKERRRYARFRYTVDGQEHRGRSYIGEQEWRGLGPGAPVQVGYLPSDPGAGWIAGHEPEGVPFWIAPLAVAGCGLGSFLLVWKVRRERRLLSEGRAAVARVTRSKRVWRGKHRMNHVHYEFKVLSGAARTGWYETNRQPPPEGTEVVILYDPYDNRRQARYPMHLVRIG
jgi:hypothetical protein